MDFLFPGHILLLLLLCHVPCQAAAGEPKAAGRTVRLTQQNTCLYQPANDMSALLVYLISPVAVIVTVLLPTTLLT